jgi:hypothetical protein
VIVVNEKFNDGPSEIYHCQPCLKFFKPHPNLEGVASLGGFKAQSKEIQRVQPRLRFYIFHFFQKF